LKIAVLTPCHYGNVNVYFAISLISAFTRVKKAEATFLSSVGSSMLPHARNMLVAQAMHWGADKLIFIDDDISFDSESFQRLCLHPEPIVAGTYQKKPHDVHAAPDLALSALPEGLNPDHRGLVEVDGAPTGFMRVDRGVFEELKSTCMKMCDDAMPPEHEAELYQYFEFTTMQKERGVFTAGEDYAFCRKARKAGFRTWIDPTMKLGHHVGQFRFGASLGNLPLL